jgi:D-3-phosphoglycerate dehydrogenase
VSFLIELFYGALILFLTIIVVSFCFNPNTHINDTQKCTGEIAYNVLDIDTTKHDGVVEFKDVQERITMVDGVISTRVIFGQPGKGYAKNLEGDYFI